MELEDMILRLKEIKQERERLDTEERHLSMPILKDYDLIPEVYEYCRKAYKELHPNHHRENYMVRRKYLFIILFLFSPKTLAGGKMSSGLRTRISKVMNLEPSNVSHYYSNIWFTFSIYKDFRDDVNNLFKLVFEELKREEMALIHKK